jgi:hypothetical protein
MLYPFLLSAVLAVEVTTKQMKVDPSELVINCKPQHKNKASESKIQIQF